MKVEKNYQMVESALWLIKKNVNNIAEIYSFNSRLIYLTNAS